jgi:hypothetical protein
LSFAAPIEGSQPAEVLFLVLILFLTCHPDDSVSSLEKLLPSPEISSSEQKISEVPGVNRYG